MIEASQLRIGNWVIDPFDDYRKIDAVDNKGEVALYRDGISSRDGCYVSGINPIPLTPEILEKAGLKRIDDFYFIINSDFVISIDGNVEFERPDNITHFVEQVKYLHQLQNLYFALTNTELIINL